MKYSIYNSLIIICFFTMLLFPEAVFSGACKGLLLWFNTILPTLLPFLILSNILLNTSAIHLLIPITSPLFCKIFRTSPYGSFAILCGFLCGYPIGGKITSDLFKTGKISRNEAAYLLSFCNNTSPMFVIGYIVHQTFQSKQLVIPTLFILVLSPVICSILFHHIYCPNIYNSIKPNISNSTDKNTNLLDFCIMNSFETLTKIGGYIIIFSVFIDIFTNFSYINRVISTLFLASLEITNGVSMINSLHLPFSFKYVATLSLTSFGGWCSIAQTYSITKDSKLSVKNYIIEKLVTALVTSFLAFIFIQKY